MANLLVGCHAHALQRGHVLAGEFSSVHKPLAAPSSTGDAD
ncbi:MAG: hypothetical protein WDZ51_07755 [Pirellulaceae bacterium]